MKFTAIDPVTRQVLFAGTTDSTQDFQEDVLIVEGVAHFGEGWVTEDAQFEPMPPKPSRNHVFNWQTKQWEDARTAATEWPLVRARRNDLLTACDWTQLPDVPLATKEAWAAYRQALRDITEQADPFSIVWPTPPA